MKKLLRQLVIDTATNYIYLSLVIDGEEKQSIYEEGINNHSATIIPYLESLLKKESIELKDINQVIIGIGPGSYTGVRIGVTVAKMIGYLNKIDVYTISSLALIASYSDSEYVLPLIDARRNNAFMAVYQNTNRELKLVEADCLENVEIFQERINFDFAIVNKGKPKIKKILDSKLLNKVDDIHSLTPNYLRVTEAERNLKNETHNPKNS
jgi:tRNA threonylcarbamoyladenosine biosynthesis protein TsaB